MVYDPFWFRLKVPSEDSERRLWRTLTLHAVPGQTPCAYGSKSLRARYLVVAAARRSTCVRRLRRRRVTRRGAFRPERTPLRAARHFSWGLADRDGFRHSSGRKIDDDQVVVAFVGYVGPGAVVQRSDPRHTVWACGANKEECYLGMTVVGLIDPSDPTHSPIASPTLSPLVWINPSGGNMPFDAQVENASAREAIAAWVAAGARDD
jgi:hypothetical protein